MPEELPRESGSIAIATCRDLPEPDVDEDLLIAALRERGHRVELVAWDLPTEEAGVRTSAGRSIDLDTFDLCVIRSTWNYLEDPTGFRAWLAHASERTALWNPLSTCLENLDKHYLAGLEAAGVPIVPTWFVDRGAPFELAERWGGVDWDAVVIKPTISAGSFGTRLFRRDELAAAIAFLEEGRTERDWMVQRYEASVETTGERAIVCFDGGVSHAVRKSPRFSGDCESVSAAFEPEARDRAFADRVLSTLGETLYARVDVIDDAEGKIRLAELELLEPSLFLLQSPAGLERFIAAIEMRLDGSGSSG